MTKRAEDNFAWFSGLCLKKSFFFKIRYIIIIIYGLLKRGICYKNKFVKPKINL